MGRFQITTLSLYLALVATAPPIPAVFADPPRIASSLYWQTLRTCEGSGTGAAAGSSPALDSAPSVYRQLLLAAARQSTRAVLALDVKALAQYYLNRGFSHEYASLVQLPDFQSAVLECRRQNPRRANVFQVQLKLADLSGTVVAGTASGAAAGFAIRCLTSQLRQRLSPVQYRATLIGLSGTSAAATAWSASDFFHTPHPSAQETHAAQQQIHESVYDGPRQIVEENIADFQASLQEVHNQLADAAVTPDQREVLLARKTKLETLIARSENQLREMDAYEASESH